MRYYTEASYAAMMREAGFADVSIRTFDVSSAEHMRERAVRKGYAETLSAYSDEQLEGVRMPSQVGYLADNAFEGCGIAPA